MVRMRFLFLRCGAPDIPMPAEAHDLSAVPTRKELALIDAFLSPLLPTAPAEALEFARTAPVRPTPLIRNDSGLAVAGSATISDATNAPFTGEIIIDDHTLAASSPKTFGARLVPMTDAPGILAARATSPVESQGRLRSLLRKPGRLDPESVHTGRAVQAGGPQLRVIVDSVPHKRPVTRVTFYRHLRDLQIVRP